MRIVNLEELSKMPNGTVFSKINDPSFYKGVEGDMDIDGLNIMCGHDDKWCPIESGKFNGVLHMLNYVPLYRDSHNKVKIESDFIFGDNTVADYAITDTAKHDYDKNDMFVIYDKTDVIEIINVLQWALTGCESELLVRYQLWE